MLVIVYGTREQFMKDISGRPNCIHALLRKPYGLTATVVFSTCDNCVADFLSINMLILGQHNIDSLTLQFNGDRIGDLNM